MATNHLLFTIPEVRITESAVRQLLTRAYMHPSLDQETAAKALMANLETLAQEVTALTAGLKGHLIPTIEEDGTLSWAQPVSASNGVSPAS